MRGDTAGQTAMLGARLAAAHEAGKVVLLDMVADSDAAATKQSLTRDTIARDRSKWLRVAAGPDPPHRRWR